MLNAQWLQVPVKSSRPMTALGCPNFKECVSSIVTKNWARSLNWAHSTLPWQYDHTTRTEHWWLDIPFTDAWTYSWQPEDGCLILLKRVIYYTYYLYWVTSIELFLKKKKTELCMTAQQWVLLPCITVQQWVLLLWTIVTTQKTGKKEFLQLISHFHGSITPSSQTWYVLTKNI